MYVIRKFPDADTPPFECNQYSQVRRKTGTECVKRHAKAGTKVTNHAVKMSNRDLWKFSEMLFYWADFG